MIIDMRREAEDLRALLVRRVNEYASEIANSPQPSSVSAIEIGYYLCQDGWIVVHFDTRPQHTRDGECSNFTKNELIQRPEWQSAHDAVQQNGGEFILPDGTRLELPAETSCEALADIFGRMIKDVLIAAKSDGVFNGLPKREGCQMDVEEFDGMWAWPDYEQLGKVNLA